MKSKEEIEQLANDYIYSSDDDTIEFGFIEGYTQCQEDMADKKYTERQLRDAMEDAMCFSKLKEITEYINSLNKQDNG